jgi:hypothetical protein
LDGKSLTGRMKGSFLALAQAGFRPFAPQKIPVVANHVPAIWCLIKQTNQKPSIGTPNEQTQARKVKARPRMSGSVSQSCRFFGVSRSLYIWKKCFEQKSVSGLRDLKRRLTTYGTAFLPRSFPGMDS